MCEFVKVKESVYWKMIRMMMVIYDDVIDNKEGVNVNDGVNEYYGFYYYRENV